MSLTLCAGVTHAQNTPQHSPPGTTSAPVVDSSTQASPIKAQPGEPAVDASADASPITGSAHSMHLPANTTLPVRLSVAVNSGHLRNGDHIAAVLSSAVKTTAGQHLPAGTHITLTVISVSPAGTLASAGEFTLEVVRVGTVAVLSDEQTFHGKEGHKDLPDSAPAKGTEASLPAGTVLHFHLPPIPH